MKRFIYGLGAGGVLVLVLVWIWLSGPKPAGFVVGPPLPLGKVTPQIISAGDIAILLAPDGSLWAWGGNDGGLRGFYSKPTITTLPQRLGSNSDWRKVAGGWQFALAVKDDGSLWGIGNNFSGQLAQPRTAHNVNSFTQIGRDKDWTEISAGAGHCLALKRDGSLWAWGQNQCGQVGDGTVSNKFTPIPLGPAREWQAIAAGAFNSYAIKRDGTIWGWGLDAITGGTNHTLVPTQIGPGSDWISLSAGDFSVVAMKSDGTLWIRGQNASLSASTFVRASSASFIQIGRDKTWREAYAGGGYFLARKRDGEWWASGQNEYGQLGMNRCSRPFAEPRCLPFRFDPWALALGRGNTLLLAKDGTLWTWGQRLGSDERPASAKVKGVVNRVLDFLPANFKRFKSRIEGPRSDWIPFPLWKLPPSARPSPNQADLTATNGAQP